MHDILIEEKILAENDDLAIKNRRALKERGIFSINMVSAPGAGKTTLIEKLIPGLNDKVKGIAVIEGDLETEIDAQRLRKFDIPVKQITTGKVCHLDAHMISNALPWLFANRGIGLLIIENVGNMVCPAEFDLGEDMMVTVLSATEGDDKPLKYPAIFNASDALVINKMDLAKHTNFSIEKAKENALSINPYLEIFETSCFTNEGIEELVKFIAKKAYKKTV